MQLGRRDRIGVVVLASAMLAGCSANKPSANAPAPAATAAEPQLERQDRKASAMPAPPPGGTTFGRLAGTTARVEGRVGTASGPAGKVKVELVSFPSGEVVFAGETDADGAFAVPSLAPGSYTLRVRSPGLHRGDPDEVVERRVELEDEETELIDIAIDGAL